MLILIVSLLVLPIAAADCLVTRLRRARARRREKKLINRKPK